jgi:hypothetical protein
VYYSCIPVVFTMSSVPLFKPLVEAGKQNKMTARYDAIIRSYGQDGFERIQSAKILVVGAGGIGCEVSTSPSILYRITPYRTLARCSSPNRY